MKKPKIVIVIDKQGEIRNVYSDVDMELVILDYTIDSIKDGYKSVRDIAGYEESCGAFILDTEKKESLVKHYHKQMK